MQQIDQDPRFNPASENDITNGIDARLSRLIIPPFFLNLAAELKEQYDLELWNVLLRQVKYVWPRQQLNPDHQHPFLQVPYHGSGGIFRYGPQERKTPQDEGPRSQGKLPLSLSSQIVGA
jgi:hypothetical protein